MPLGKNPTGWQTRNLSYLRSGILTPQGGFGGQSPEPLRSIPCLGSVVPSVRDSASLHTLPGVCRTFGTSGFCGTWNRGYALRAPPSAWGLPSLWDCRAAWDSSLFTLHSSMFNAQCSIFFTLLYPSQLQLLTLNSQYKSCLILGDLESLFKQFLM